MQNKESWMQGMLRLMKRELKIVRRRPLYVFCMLIAPIFFCFMFTSIMGAGGPSDLPCALVDEDDTQITRTLVRTLDAMQETEITVKYRTFSDARAALLRGEVYGIFHIPEGTTEKALTQRQPKIYCYTNDAYLLAGAFLFKDMKMMGEMSGLAITKETLTAKGVPSDMVMGLIQPIVIESHALNNPALNYSIYLTNMILPGIFLLMVFLCTTYSIGYEWKMNTHRQWLSEAGDSVATALFGKLFPQTAVFLIVFLFMDVYLYKFLAFPCQCGMLTLAALQLLAIVASQGFAVGLYGMFLGQMRMAMSAASLVGVLSVSLSGFTFPVQAMPPVLEAGAWMVPLRHYFLLYLNQVLNGYPLVYAWKSVAILMGMAAIPLLFLRSYEYAFKNVDYKA